MLEKEAVLAPRLGRIGEGAASDAGDALGEALDSAAIVPGEGAEEK
jgi:hypothetical protein